MSAVYGQDYDDYGQLVSDDGIIWLNQVKAERIAWLWPGRLPKGKLVVLDGDPGVGKSTLVIDWIARISTGTPWPDGTECRKGCALIMSAEDGAGDTIRPRLDAAEGDPANVALWTEVVFTDEQGERRTRPPILPADIETLEKKIRSTESALVMIDVLPAYLDATVNAHKDQDIRRVLHRLSKMAERTNCCILLLRHLNKSSGNNAIYRGGGSIGIIGAARAGFIAARDPQDESGNTRVLACTKMNIAKEPAAFTYTLADSELHGCARVQWGEISERTAADLLEDGDAEANELDDAVGWLQGYLIDNGGQVLSKDAKTAARKERISERTLQRALKGASVTVSSEGFPRRTVWELDVKGIKSRQSRHTPRVVATVGQVVQFPQVKPSSDSRDSPSSATRDGATALWPDGSNGATQNDHEE